MDVETLAREFYEFRGEIRARMHAIEKDLTNFAQGYRNSRVRTGIYAASGGGGIFLLAEVITRLLGIH